MKYKAVTGMIGASVILASLSGCGAKKSTQETETELQTLLIENVEVVEESEMEILLETELTTETGTEQAPADLALDLSGENEDEAGPAEDDQLILEETDFAEPESGKANAGKPGEPETQPEKADPSGSEKTGDEAPADEKQTGEEKTEKGQSRPGSREADTEDDTEAVSTENESDEASAIHAAADSPADKDADTEKEPAAAKAQTGSGTEAESADAPGAEAQTESGEEDKSADAPEAEGQTESEAEDKSADSIRTERQSESDTEMTETFETGVTAGEEIEAETVPEAETDLETEAETDAEAGAEQDTDSEIEAETDAETDSETEAVQDQETDPEAGQDSESAAEENRETGDMPDAETDSETDAETDSETEAVQDQETESETEPESETDSEEETESETELPEEETGIRLVKGDRVNVRETPSTEAEIMASLSKGMDIYALDEEDDWTHICYENMADIAEGFVKSEYLGKPEEFYKANTRVNVRMEASTEADKAGALSEGDIVFVLEQESSGWSRIQFTDEDGETIEAYVKTEFLEQIDPESIDSAFREKVESLYGLNGPGETAAGNGVNAGNEQAGTVTDAGDGQTSSDEENAPQFGAEAEETEGQGTKTSKKSDKDAQSSLPEDATDAQRQLALFRQLYPDAGKVGVIYSSDNTDAAAQLAKYESFAGQYGIELVSAEIKDEIDIDMAASEMAGAVDGILYMEDPIVAGLLQTVCAYANEVGIPVIGLEQSQTDQGCVAAYEGGKLFWNADGAAALGLSPENPEE